LERANAQIPTLQASSNAQSRQIQVQEKELAALRRKLKDREEEIKGKQKVASDVQDEMISLNLQLSVAEQKTEKLERENKALVERWMKEMGGRAEKMNRDMGFGGKDG
jgi:chromosome segregation ATPase